MSPARCRAARAALGLGAIAVAAALLVGGSPRGHGHPTPPTPTQRPPTPTQTAPAPTAPATPGPAAQPAPAGEQFGVNVNRLFNDGTYTAAQIDGQLQALAQTGAGLARSDALWETAEPAPPVNGVHRYRWAFDDEIAAALAAHGLRWLPIIDYSASWAQSIPGQDHSPPAVPADYAAYAAAFAGRYGRGGSFWSAHPSLPPQPVNTYEIWNEPGNPYFWLPTPNASRYAELYAMTRQAIAAVDPSARVIVGGLTNAAAFLAAMLRALPELRGRIDGVAIHPYGPNEAAVLSSIQTTRRVLRSLGLGTVPLYVTEFGWTTHPVGVRSYLPERLRPSYISRTLAALGHVACGVAAAVLYTWVTPERNPANGGDWYGIHPADGASSADTVAFATGLRQAVARGPQIPLCSE